MLNEHWTDFFLEEFVVPGLELRRRHQRSGSKRGECQSRAELQVRTKHSRNFPKLWPPERNDKTCRPRLLWYRRVCEGQRSSQASARAAIPSLPDPCGRWRRIPVKHEDFVALA